MIEVFENGKLKARLETHKDYSDIMILPRRIAEKCRMTSESFDELFYSILEGGNGITHRKAYEEAEKLHERYLGRRRYENFDSFRKSRDQRIRK